MGFPTDFYCTSMIFLEGFFGNSVGFPPHGISMIFLWDYYWISMGCRWYFYGITIGFQKDAHGIP